MGVMPAMASCEKDQDQARIVVDSQPLALLALRDSARAEVNELPELGGGIAADRKEVVDHFHRAQLRVHGRLARILDRGDGLLPRFVEVSF